jgi:hypothetical protein
MSEQKTAAKEKAKTPRVKEESIKTELFGDLMKFSKKNPREILPLKKYDSLAVELVSKTREERLLVYKFLCGLALSAHARRTNDQQKRREIFDLKNKIFLAIANNLNLRRVLNFRFCVSKRFKVNEYCETCASINKQEDRKTKEKSFCNRCNIDRTYYNVLSMFHKFDDGGASLYLGKELMTQVHALKLLKHVDIDKLPEQLAFKNLRFTPHNLISLDLASVIEVANKLLALAAKEQTAMPAPTAKFSTGARTTPRTPSARPYTRAGTLTKS